MTTTLSENIFQIQQEFRDIAFSLDERRLRLWCAAKARAHDRQHGRGGIAVVTKATGISRPTIYAGLREIESPKKLAPERLRQPGGGRKKLIETAPDLLEALDRLVEPDSRGDPESPLRWTCKSTYQLAAELRQQGYSISHAQVGKLLARLGYSLQANKKSREGTAHPDRDAQFAHIHKEVQHFHTQEQPVISVDTKKKENLGAYKNPGREYRPKKQPRLVNGHDFADKELGKVVPYGIYDLKHNQGWVSVGINNDTAEFAVNAIRTWLTQVGQPRYPQLRSLMITADCGGSNGYRSRLWKQELQQLANEFNLFISVCHYPPGTSKWNKIEHRMFSFISRNWKGQPLVDRQTVIELISHTKTKQGLEIMAVLDENTYHTGRKVSDKEMAALHIEKAEFHGEWNYMIKPQVIT